MNRLYRVALLVCVCGLLTSRAIAEETATASVSLQEGLKPFLQMLSGKQSRFDLQGELDIQIDGKSQPIQLRLTRFDDEAFDLELSHPDYAVQICRRLDSTALILPLHKVAYVGTGDVDDRVRLSPREISSRLISGASEAKPIVTLLSVIQPEFLDPLLEFVKKPLKAERDPVSQQWVLTKASPVRFPAAGQILIEADFGRIGLQLTDTVPDLPCSAAPQKTASCTTVASWTT